MSAKEPEDKSFAITTAQGAKSRYAARYARVSKSERSWLLQDRRKLGFRHVIVGQEIESGAAKETFHAAIRFKYCLSCGYILKFMFLQDEKDWGDEG